MQQLIGSEIELLSLMPESMPVAPNHLGPLSWDEEKVPEHANFLEEVNQGYSSDSSKNLIADLAEDFELSFQELLSMAGPWLGAGIWLFLKVCSPSTRKKVLGIISPIRNTIKSMRTINQTAEMTGILNRLPGPLKTGIGSATGLVAAALMTMVITPKIRILEERLQRRVKLNQLLTKRLQQSATIPQGLSELQLLQWLEDPLQFADLPRREIHETDFADVDLQDAVRLGHLKKLAEIINGVYALSVLNGDVVLSGAKAVFGVPFVSLVTNTVVGSITVYNSYRIAEHHTQGLLLKAEQSCLAGKLVLCKSSPVTQQQVQAQLSRCEQRIDYHQRVDFSGFHLSNATAKGYMEGGDLVDLIVGVPISILVLAHLASATCPPIFFTVLAITIVTGLYVGYHRYRQKQQEIAKQNLLKHPAQGLAVTEEIELQSLPDKKVQSKQQTTCTGLAAKTVENIATKNAKPLEIELQPFPSKPDQKSSVVKSKEAAAPSGLAKLSLKFKQFFGIRTTSPSKEIELKTFKKEFEISHALSTIGILGSQSKTHSNIPSFTLVL